MKKFIALLVIALCFSAQAAFQLTRDGKPNATIVIPEKAPEQVKYAARELTDFIYRMSGAKLVTTTDKKAKNPIFIGFDTKKYEVEQIRIFCDGKSLTLTGGGDFGPLMAVYAFLRDQDIFWPMREEMWLEIPQKKTVECADMDLVQKPHFHARNLHNFPRDHRRLFRWMAFNGWRSRSMNPPGTMHVNDMLEHGISPAFATHTWGFWSGRKALNENIEWNPLYNGKRTPPPLNGPPWWSSSQPCIGNPDLRTHMYRNMVAYLLRNPRVKTLAMEANDGGGYCKCELCQAYGKNGSDRVFRFAKEGAEIIQKLFPYVTVIIDAYGNHQEMPSFRLPKNMIIPVVHNNRNYGRPLTHPSNAVYYNRLKGWAENYPNQIVSREMAQQGFFKGLPLPISDVLAADVKEYSRLKLAGFFNEGLYPSPLTEYLRIRLAWDPQLDVKELTMKFCKGVYGPAAVPMYNYYRLLEDRMAITGKNLSDINGIIEFIVPIIDDGKKLLAEAEKAVAGQPRYLARVRFEKNQFYKMADVSGTWFPCSRDVITDANRAANKLPNGSFELGLKHVTCNTPQYDGCGKFGYSLSDKEFYHGKKSGCITILKPGWGRMVMTASGLIPGKKYTIAVAIKSTEGADMMHVWYTNGSPSAVLYRLGDTKGEWYRFIVRDVVAASKDGKLSVFLTIHGGVPTQGKVYFDDVVVFEQ